jgi:adenine-specific DNA-methyltransferase
MNSKGLVRGIDIDLEVNYINSVDRSHRKKYGQFFTPESIADLMVSWLNVTDQNLVLDPGVGTGVLIRSLRSVSVQSEVIGHEIDDKVVKYCKSIFVRDKKFKLIESNYLSIDYAGKFDAVIANPPYIRHHDYKISKMDKKRIESSFGPLQNTSNIYVFFVLKILLDLKPHGRASVIIPSDWLNSNFGRRFKEILFNLGCVSRVLYFQNDTYPFADNLSTATILFIDKKKTNKEFKLGLVSKSSESFVEIGKSLLSGTSNSSISEVDPTSLDTKLKWGPIFEGFHTSKPEGWIALSDAFKSRRGIATGANNYFLVSKSTLKDIEVEKKRTRKCIGRAKDVNGLVFNDSDFLELSKADAPVYLLDLDSSFLADKNYIQMGDKLGLPERFLLANRDPWYKQELRPTAQILVGVFGRDGVRFIWNKNNSTNLTAFHGLYTDLNAEDIGVVVALLNSSMMQNHNKKTERSYGGGLQKVEPKDLLDMEIPNPAILPISLKDQLTKALLDADKIKRAGLSGWRTPLDFVVNSNRSILNL